MKPFNSGEVLQEVEVREMPQAARICLVSVPAPAQCIKGEREFLGTVRTQMHKAPLTALSAGLVQDLRSMGVEAELCIRDMQCEGAERTKYGELMLGDQILEKYRVGATFESMNDTIRRSHIVGINSNFTHSRVIVSDFAKHVKSTSPGTVVVIGGTDATADAAYYLNHAADIVVRGEGELSFPKLIQTLLRSGDLAEVPNICYKVSGEVVESRATFLSHEGSFDINTMCPPALDLVDLRQYVDTGEGPPINGALPPYISVETSRGCAQACSFCATPSTKGRYRFMHSGKVLEHLEYFQRMGVTTLLFQEDNLLSRVHRRPDGSHQYGDGRTELIELFRRCREMGFCWEFTNGLEFGQFEAKGEVDGELIDAMFWRDLTGDHPQGCYRATLPLENLTDANSKLFRKLRPLGIARRVIEEIAKTGVPAISFNLIIGRPDETELDLQLSYARCLEIKALCKSLAPSMAVYFNIYILSLLPGTVDFRRNNHLLAYDISRDPEVITFYLGSLRTTHFSPLEITQARGTMAMLLNSDALIKSYDETRYITSERFSKLFASAQGYVEEERLSMPPSQRASSSTVGA